MKSSVLRMRQRLSFGASNHECLVVRLVSRRRKLHPQVRSLPRHVLQSPSRLGIVGHGRLLGEHRCRYPFVPVLVTTRKQHHKTKGVCVCYGKKTRSSTLHFGRTFPTFHHAGHLFNGTLSCGRFCTFQNSLIIDNNLRWSLKVWLEVFVSRQRYRNGCGSHPIVARQRGDRIGRERECRCCHPCAHTQV